MPTSEYGGFAKPSEEDTNAVAATYSYGQNLRITVCANQGGRKYMEDRVHIECVRYEDGSIDFTYIAVYDGHGGAEASEYVRRNLLNNIRSQNGFNGNDEQMLDAIKSGFMETHLAMWKVVDEWPLTASGYRSTAGTTASCAFIRRGKLFTAHVGDSAIILGRQQGDCVMGSCLTVDHKPDSAEEEQRINSAGGMIMRKSGVMRVVWTRPVRGHIGPVRRSTPTESIAFLAVARALGDLWSYNQDTKQFIVSPEPDVSVLELDSDDKFIVLASDGLTNVLRAKEVADIVCNCENDGCLEDGDVPNHSRVLIRHALRGWGVLRADNISVVTVMLDDEVRSASLQNSLSSKNVIVSCEGDMDLEESFTKQPASMIRVTPFGYQQLLTVPVELVYAGAMDTNFGTGLEYKGPGFSCHTRILQNHLITSCDSSSLALNMSPPARRTRPRPSPYFLPRINLSEVSGNTNTTTTTLVTSTNDSTHNSLQPTRNIEEEDTIAMKTTTTADDVVAESSSAYEHSAETCSSARVVVVSRLQRCSADAEFINEQINQQQTTSPLTPLARKRHSSAKSTTTYGSSLVAQSTSSSVNSSSYLDLSTGKPVKYYCTKHGLSCNNVRRRNEEYAASKMPKRESVKTDGVDVCENCEYDSTDDERNVNAVVTSTNEHSTNINVLGEGGHTYASSSVKTVTIVSPITTTPLSGRKRLVAIRRTPMSIHRRGQARRNLMDSGGGQMDQRMSSPEQHLDEGSSAEEEPKSRSAEDARQAEGDEEVHVPVLQQCSHPTSAKSITPPLSEGTSRRTAGCASALSPALMLAAFRAPDRILQATMKDPLARDISLSGLRSPSIRSRSLSVGHTPMLSPLKRLNAADEYNEHHAAAVNGVSADVHLLSKRELLVGAEEEEEEASPQCEPPTKRSRFWGFFSNMLGGAKSSSK